MMETMNSEGCVLCRQCTMKSVSYVESTVKAASYDGDNEL